MTTGTTPRIDLRRTYQQLDHLARDPELVEAVRACVAAQRAACFPLLDSIFSPDERALGRVSPEALREAMAARRRLRGARSEPELSNVVIFNDRSYKNAVHGDELSSARRRVDELVERRLRGAFGQGWQVRGNGFYLYPPGGYMGWHANWKDPGWRLYVTSASERGRSFFRYLEPETGRVVTSEDGELDFRLFQVRPERPLWHSIYSGTFRYSLGYNVVRQGGGLLRRLASALRSRN